MCCVQLPYKGTRQRQTLHWPTKLQKQNKSFAEAEFYKDCMVNVVTVVCPEVKSKVEAISLSRGTIVRRIDAISVNKNEQLLTTWVIFSGFLLLYVIVLT